MNAGRLPSKNSYLLLMEDMIRLAKEAEMVGWTYQEWITFRNVIDEAIEKRFEIVPNDVREDGYWDVYVGECPSCGRIVIDEDAYCNKCGQKLYWGLIK